ncbi:MAG: ADP-ribosylglycohydrolase family protein [Myxococcota bacterium]
MELERFTGCLLGLALGDALGTPLEFERRGSFAPLTDLVGGGPFGLQAGQWTDDTSMALCLGTSLVERGGFDARDQMERYVRWWRSGYLSSTGECFDIGNTTRRALARFAHGGDPFAGSAAPDSAGNGSIMRLAPVAMFFFPDALAAAHYAAESSRTTHAAPEALDACRLLAAMLCRALAGEPKEAVLRGSAVSFRRASRIAALARGAARAKPEREHRGSGYVVEPLEAALICFAHGASYADAVLRAANLGDDADTTAAVCGQLAGAHYGEAGIPAAWLARLAMREEIATLAERLARAVRP